jgi:hypothetical protein
VKEEYFDIRGNPPPVSFHVLFRKRMRRFVPDLNYTNVTEYPSLARVIKIFSLRGGVDGYAFQEIGKAGQGFGDGVA